MSEPDKDDPKAAEEARARLERVRSLLFGAQIEAWDARVGALEDQVIGSAESLRQEVEADLEALGTRLDERLRRIEGEIESFARARWPQRLSWDRPWPAWSAASRPWRARSRRPR